MTHVEKMSIRFRIRSIHS